MRVFCSGFNLYGQFIEHPGLTVNGFIDCTYEEVTGLELSHTFLVVSKGKDVFLHGAKDKKTHQTKKIQIPQTLEITQTACTNNRILFLSKNGRLFKVDLNKTEFTPTPLPITPTNESKNSDVFSKIACGSKISIAVSQQGKIFNLPNKLNCENDKIKDVCTGHEHCIILDDAGNVYSFGRGSRGQLGHGHLENEFEPKLIEALAGIKISKIAAGGWHSCAVSEEGDLYTWGWNGNGQLGLGKTKEECVSVMAVPHAVDFEDVAMNVISTACGSRHTIALLDNGKLFGAGWNKYHQLGTRIDNENVYAMELLHDFSGLGVTEIKCGPWSSAIVVP